MFEFILCCIFILLVALNSHLPFQSPTKLRMRQTLNRQTSCGTIFDHPRRGSSKSPPTVVAQFQVG